MAGTDGSSAKNDMKTDEVVPSAVRQQRQDDMIPAKETSWVENLDPKYKSLGLLAMLGSSFFFSLMALLVKLLQRFSTFELVFWRSVLMTIFATGNLLWRGIHPLGSKQVAFILSIRGILGFGFMGAYYYAIKILPLSDAVVINYTSPVLTAIAAVFVLGEPIAKIDFLGIALSMTGVIMVSKPSFIMGMLGQDVKPLPVNGVLGALGAAVFSTAVYLLLRFSKGIEPMVSTNYFAVWGIVISPVMSLLFNEALHVPTSTETLLIILLAVLSVVGQNLMNIGLAMESAGKAVAMNYTQVVFSLFYQVVLLGNYTGVDRMGLTGAGLITTWGAVSIIKDSQKNKKVSAREIARASDTQRPRLPSASLVLDAPLLAGSEDA